jgi:hypothetical protein
MQSVLAPAQNQSIPQFSRSVGSHLNLDTLQQYTAGEVRGRGRDMARTYKRPFDLVSDRNVCILRFTVNNQLLLLTQPIKCIHEKQESKIYE